MDNYNGNTGNLKVEYTRNDNYEGLVFFVCFFRTQINSIEFMVDQIKAQSGHEWGKKKRKKKGLL